MNPRSSCKQAALCLGAKISVAAQLTEEEYQRRLLPDLGDATGLQNFNGCRNTNSIKENQSA